MTNPAEAQQEEIKRNMLRKILSKPAMERLSRVRMVRPELAAQIEAYLIGLYQSGKVGNEVTEEQMKMILETIAGKREINIKRK